MLNGFSLDQIRKLTLRQIQLIYKNLQRKERRKMASHITAVSLGFNGGKEATKVVKELQK